MTVGSPSVWAITGDANASQRKQTDAVTTIRCLCDLRRTSFPPIVLHLARDVTTRRVHNSMFNSMFIDPKAASTGPNRTVGCGKAGEKWPKGVFRDTESRHRA